MAYRRYVYQVRVFAAILKAQTNLFIMPLVLRWDHQASRQHVISRISPRCPSWHSSVHCPQAPWAPGIPLLRCTSAHIGFYQVVLTLYHGERSVAAADP